MGKPPPAGAVFGTCLRRGKHGSDSSRAKDRYCNSKPILHTSIAIYPTYTMCGAGTLACALASWALRV